MSIISVNDSLSVFSDGFGAYNEMVVHMLLNNISFRTNSMGNYTNRQLPKVEVMHWDEDYPMCSNCGDRRLILLTTHDNYWCQWIYQFSHEFCHHIIDGSMTGEIKGQIWFEETLCSLNSMYQLEVALLEDFKQAPFLQLYAPSVLVYLDEIKQSHQDLKCQLQQNGGLLQWLPLLSKPTYHRDHYYAIACLILPLFVENPHLWGILSHIGDSRSYATIGELFDHLRDTADDSYRDSLEKMIALLLP